LYPAAPLRQPTGPLSRAALLSRLHQLRHLPGDARHERRGVSGADLAGRADLGPAGGGRAGRRGRAGVV